jgi:hypothetical protein
MDQTDRLAYEVAMAALRDTREECLRWLEDQESEPAAVRRRSPRWFSLDPRTTPLKRRLAS